MHTEGLLQFLSVRLNEFLHRFAFTLPPSRQKLLWELVPGILASGSLELSQIVRTWITHSGQLKPLEKHLSLQLASVHWDHRPLAETLLSDQAAEVKEDSIIAIDFSELVKVYGQKLEYLDWVSDRSDPDKPTRPGYWLFQAYRVDKADQVAPLYIRLFSNRQPRFEGQTKLFDDEVFHLRRVLNGRGIWAHDRGFDGWNYLKPLLTYEQPRWIVRMRGDRHVIDVHGVKKSVREWADQIRQGLRETQVAGGLKVRLPNDKRWLTLVTSRWRPDTEVEPWMLLAKGFDQVPYTPRRVLSGYVRRWRSEDGIRLFKQRLGWETFMVRYFRAMQRLLLMGQLSFAFLAELVAEDSAMVGRIEDAALHFDEPIKIRAYRVARGVQRLTAGRPFQVDRR
jgi:hypothetical protein